MAKNVAMTNISYALTSNASGCRSTSRTDVIITRMAEERLPRYTSYPTAPAFSGAIGDETYTRWLGALPSNTALSLYLHVPFCRAMCWYCGCTTKITRRDGPVANYAAMLEREVDLIADRLPAHMALEHIHWGGGTPSILGDRRFSALYERLAKRFSIVPQAEQAIELDPRTMDSLSTDVLSASGINRVSFGVQTFDAKVQAAINRIQPYEQVATAVENCRSSGIRQVSFDLIYGLPHQTVDSATATAQRALALDPDRISVFGYAHVPWAKPHQRLIPDETLPDARERAAQFSAMEQVFTDAGYIAIGIDHFAKPDDTMAAALRNGTLRRNFQGYTTDPCDTIIGLGASAIGTLPTGYAGNTPSIADYCRAIGAGNLATTRGYALTADDRLRGAVINALMCGSSVSAGAVAAQLTIDQARVGALLEDSLPTLSGLVEAGLVTWDGERLSIDPEARLLVRTVASAFDAHLPNTNGRHAKAI